MSDVEKNSDGSMSKDEETGLVVKDSVGLDSLNIMHVQKTNNLTSSDDTDLHSSFVDDGEQSFPDIESVPSAVLQKNGEFMCSRCGVTMKCARAIKRHISTHMSMQSFRPSTNLSCDAADNVNDVSNDDVTQSEPQEQLSAYDRWPTQGNSADSSKIKQESSEDIDINWRSYPCKECNRIFTTSALLQRHHVQMHKPNECQKCGMVFAGKWYFSQHIHSEHPDLQICKVRVFATHTGIE